MGLLKRGNLDMDPHRGRMPGEQGTPKTARKPAEARREAWNGCSLRASRRDQSCPHLWTFTPQSCETLLWLKPPTLCYFVTAALGTKYRV